MASSSRRGRHAVRSQAIGWRTATRSPATAMSPGAPRRTATAPRGRRRDRPRSRPRSSAPSAIVGRRREDARRRADDQSLGGEQVLALVVRRRRRGLRARRTRAACRAPRACARRRRGRPATVRLAMPVSTPPGPSSTKVGDAASASASRHCRQRTGLQSCADSRLAQSSPSSWARASTFETTGTSVSRGSASAIALRSRSRAGAMNGVWNAPLTGSGSTFLAPSSLACTLACGDPFGRAGDHDLAGSVEVGDPHVAVGAAAGDLDLVVVEPEHGGHRAGLVGAGVVHRLGALDDQPHALVERRARRWR